MAIVIIESKDPASIVTPAGGTVELFRDVTNSNHLSYMDSSRNVTDLEKPDVDTDEDSDSDADCCACKIQTEYWCAVTKALNRGLLNAAQFQSLVSLGFKATASEVKDNLGNETCTVTSGPLGIAVISISPAPSTITLAVAGTQQITTTFTPTNASDKRLIYVSSNTDKATVSSTGLITAVSTGAATIYVYSVSDPTIVATVAVTIS